MSADVFGAGWRTVFLVNAPIGVLLLLAGPRVLRRTVARAGCPWTSRACSR